LLQSNGPRYAVETGRRDGKASAMSDADNDLPPPFSNIVDLKTYFSVKGLGWKDLVVLSGSIDYTHKQPMNYLASIGN
jgi:peroxidase